MPAYQSPAGSTIGALLRAIQEEKEASPLQQKPGTQVGSPIRELVQPPVFQPEAPDSSRMIAIRPEGAMPEGGPMVVPPVSPEPVSPVAPVGPVGASNIPGGSSQVQGQSVAGRSAPVYSAPSLATKITSSPNTSWSATGGKSGSTTKVNIPVTSFTQTSKTSSSSKSPFSGLVGLAKTLIPQIARIGGAALEAAPLAMPMKVVNDFFKRQISGRARRT